LATTIAGVFKARKHMGTNGKSVSEKSCH